MNYNDIINKYEAEAYALSEIDHAEQLENRIKINEVAEADKEWEELLKQIPDSELRQRVDLAAGRIAFAYSKLGFMNGYMVSKLVLNL